MINISTPTAIAALSALALLGLGHSGPSGLSEAEAATNPVNKSAEPAQAVFNPPTSAEISKIAVPKLRAELLQMAELDQLARTAGK